MAQTSLGSISIPLPPPPIDEVAIIPDGAVMKSGCIFQLADSKTILKVERHIRMTEVEAMRFVASRTSIPVPHVHEAYERDGIGYIFMSKVDGVPLGKVWRKLSEQDQATIVDQLRGYIAELRQLHGEFYGALWNRPSRDIFFRHLIRAKPENQEYGPYNTRQEYNEGLVEALRNSRPTGKLEDSTKPLVEKLLALKDERKIFSHGDLHVNNIMVEGTKVTGILDWAGAGFSINQRDYTEARMRSITSSHAWKQALESIFPDEAKAGYEVFTELDQSIVRYSGF